jgi:hypothetical protein
VDVRLVRPSRREEADEEGLEAAVVLDDERRVGEVVEEEPREQRAQVAFAPPLVHDRDRGLVVGRPRRPDLHRGR